MKLNDGVTLVGDGQVYLIAGGGKTYTDLAAKFCRSNKPVVDIIDSPQNLKLIEAIASSRHSAALEFDDFIFGVEGYARVTEIQLVRKRHASYMIKSGREGDEMAPLTLPESVMDLCIEYKGQEVSTEDLIEMHKLFYREGIKQGVPAEEMRYLSLQGTTFKAAIKMNAAALKDWAQIRMCYRAQTEIRDLCTKMVNLAVKATPELFPVIGSTCKVIGYCPEGEQCSQLKGKMPTEAEAREAIREWCKKRDAK